MIATVTHHSKPVKKWERKYIHKIKLFYLPSDSPELNPKETLNANLKHAIYSKVPLRNKNQLKAATNENIQTLEKSPECVKKYFQNFRVKYAALKPNWPDQYHCRRTPGDCRLVEEYQ